MNNDKARQKVLDRTKRYAELALQAESLIKGESDIVANMANLSALLNLHLDDINWVGFYNRQGNELVLGPFQGKPACIRIPVGRGVCGTAAKTKQIQVIGDVHQFDGHIACDAASNSEIVIPVIVKDQVVAVLDIDSPILSRFDQEDARGLSEVVNILQESLL